MEELKASDLDAWEQRARDQLRYHPKAGMSFRAKTILALIALARRSLPSPEAGGGNPHHWTPNQSTGGNWRCTKCGLATMEIASSATPERCSVIVASPPDPEAGGVIAELRDMATVEYFGPELVGLLNGAADLAERQASDLSTKDAENARLRGIASDYARHPCETLGLEDLEPGCCGPCRARSFLNPTKGAGA